MCSSTILSTFSRRRLPISGELEVQRPHLGGPLGAGPTYQPGALVSKSRCGPALRTVQDAKNEDRGRVDAADDDIRRADHDQFACLTNAAWTAHRGVVAQSSHRRLDRVADVDRRPRVVCGDPLDLGFEAALDFRAATRPSRRPTGGSPLQFRSLLAPTRPHLVVWGAFQAGIVGFTDGSFDLAPEPGIVVLQLLPTLHRIPHQDAQGLRGRAVLRPGHLCEADLRSSSTRKVKVLSATSPIL